MAFRQFLYHQLIRTVDPLTELLADCAAAERGNPMLLCSYDTPAAMALYRALRPVTLGKHLRLMRGTSTISGTSAYIFPSPLYTGTSSLKGNSSLTPFWRGNNFRVTQGLSLEFHRKYI